MPISRLKQILGMNSYDDPTALPQNVVRLVENMRPKKTTLDTREGAINYNSIQIPGGVGVYGLGVYTPDPISTYLMAVCNGSLLQGVSGVFTSVAQNLASTSICTLEQFGKFELVCDQHTGLLAYENGRSPYYAGLPSPKIYTLIDSFENIASWSIASGTATPDYGHFIHGEQSLLLTCKASNTASLSCTLSSPLNLNLFADNSLASTSAWISFYCLRADPANFTGASLSLIGTTYANRFEVRLDTRSEWTADIRKYIAIAFQIPKLSFITLGSPNWGSISTIQFRASSGAASAQMNLDWLRLEKSPPITSVTANFATLQGIYNYRMTFVAESGEESDPSYISSSIAASYNSVSLVNLPISGSSRIAARNLYRIGGTLSSWRLAYHFVDNVQTTFVDTVPDADLPSTIYTPIDGQPFIPKTFCIHDNFVILANLTGLDGLLYPCGVMVSEEFSFDVYNNLEMFELEPHSGAGIEWVLSMFGFVFVGKDDSIWRFNPLNLTESPIAASRSYGGVGVLAKCVGENAFYFLDPTGVVRFDGSTFTLISEAGPSKIKDYIKRIPEAYLGTCWMEYFDQTILIGVPQEGNTYPTIVLAYDVPRSFWYVITSLSTGPWSARCSTSHITSMYLGHSTIGRVYDAFVGTDDAGATITSSIHLKDDSFDLPERMKDYDKLYVFANKTTPDDAYLLVEIFLDGQSITSIGNVSGSGFGIGSFGTGLFGTGTYTLLESPYPRMLELNVTQLGYQGAYLGLKISCEKPWSLKEIVQTVRLLDITTELPKE